MVEPSIVISHGSKHYGFIVRFLYKLNGRVDMEKLDKPDVVFFEIENSFHYKMLISALGFLAIG